LIVSFSGIASGSMMNNAPPAYGSSGMSRQGYDFNAGQDFGHMSDNSLDPLNAMEKSLNEQVRKVKSLLLLF
jgi:hypothetical protein